MPHMTYLLDIVFPGQTNHHGTLFGGVGLSNMDKVAFMAATRHGGVDFVTASCERIDFLAPAQLGEIAELAGKVVRVGRSSLSVEVDLVAEAPVTGERRRCARGLFNMVAVDKDLAGIGGKLPGLAPEPVQVEGRAALRMADLVLPEQTSHYGSLYGGAALSAMAKAAFIAASRHCRARVVLAGVKSADFQAQIHEGEIVELVAAVAHTGRTSMTVTVALWAEQPKTGGRRQCGEGSFTMVAVDESHRPLRILTDSPVE